MLLTSPQNTKLNISTEIISSHIRNSFRVTFTSMTYVSSRSKFQLILHVNIYYVLFLFQFSVRMLFSAAIHPISLPYKDTGTTTYKNKAVLLSGFINLITNGSAGIVYSLSVWWRIRKLNCKLKQMENWGV